MTTGMTVAEPGDFIPMFDYPRNGRRSTNVGWVVMRSGCHLWLGNRTKGGYGTMKHEGTMRMVHRVRYAAEIGPIPEGMELDHYVCSDPLCCNPKHLRPVTPRENTLRGNTVASRLAALTHCSRGHELSGDNIAPWGVKRGVRWCRQCNTIRCRERHRRIRESKR